jgi:membrane protein required for colicin V production
MNLLDFILISILVFCLIRGIFRGLVKELTAIVGVLSGFYAAYSYYPHLSKYLGRWITNTGYANIVGCLLLFAGIYLAVGITGALIRYFMKIVFLGWTDRLCGLFFGAFKGALIVAVLVVALTTFLPKDASILKGSSVVRHTQGLSTMIVKAAAASADLEERYQVHLKELKQTWRIK